MLYWYSDELKRGIAVDYPSVGIHAICREPDLYSPAPCIYCQLDGDDFDENNVEQPTEVRFVPENSESGMSEDLGAALSLEGVTAAFDDVYQALSHCASLHPDRDSTGDDSEGADDAPTVYFADGEPDVSRDEDALITDANAGDVQLTPEGEATM
ncbi:MAG: regulator of volume decrease after cellular swelling-domain-containing protein, partial [Olpidium bornovanus]